MTMPRILLVMALIAGVGFGQEKTPQPAAKPPSKFYNLDFTVKELDGGKVVNSRSYSMSVATDTLGSGSVRADERVSVRVVSNNYQTFDVGTNLDCVEAKETGDRLMLRLTSDISYLVPGGNEVAPIVRHNRWSGYSLVPLKRTVVVFTSADPSSKGTLEMDVIATPVN
jgi:hypothetical protein